MRYEEPSFRKSSFSCPHCNAYAHMQWASLAKDTNKGHFSTNFYSATCSCCQENSIWLHSSMVYPDINISPPPEIDMPEDVKTDYLEAASIFSRSPRGAAALLRLGLQKLCKHLGQKGENINTDIRALAKEDLVPAQVIQVADTLRIVGNNAVHPGDMSDDDFDHVASKMFNLLNFIVKKAITEPKELTELYEMVPEAPRKSAENADFRNKS